MARQFATGKKVLVIRNGWFSYRWTQIFEMGRIPAATTVLKARRCSAAARRRRSRRRRSTKWSPPSASRSRPLVFAPHVETASGMILPDDYLRAVADAVHEVGGLFVLDCIASGTIWVDMQATGVDVLISAPQKGWSGSPCCALVMLGERGARAHRGHHQHQLRLRPEEVAADHGGLREAAAMLTTRRMPTDALARLRDVMKETEAYGFDKVKAEQQQLGDKVRALLAAKGFQQRRAPRLRGARASWSATPTTRTSSPARSSLAAGLQTAAGVPLQCDEPADFRTFRIGLFGLEKLHNIERTVATLDKALGQVV